MQKYASAFLTIGEVADTLDIPQHVLRYWETRFSHIKPIKKQRGRRYYRPEDVDLLRGIRFLLYAERFTIRGVQRILTERGKAFVATCWQRDASVMPVWQQTQADDISSQRSSQKSPQTLAEGKAHGKPDHFRLGAVPDDVLASHAGQQVPEQRNEPVPAEMQAVQAGKQMEHPDNSEVYHSNRFHEHEEVNYPRAPTFEDVAFQPTVAHGIGVEYSKKAGAAVADARREPVFSSGHAAAPEFPEPPLVRDHVSEGVPAERKSSLSLPGVEDDVPVLEASERETQLDGSRQALSGEVDKLKSLLSDLQGMRDSYRKFEASGSAGDRMSKVG